MMPPAQQLPAGLTARNPQAHSSRELPFELEAHVLHKISVDVLTRRVERWHGRVSRRLRQSLVASR